METTHGATILDLEGTARNMVDAAVAVTTGRLHLASPLEVRRRIVRGDATALTYFRHELARQVATTLLWIDRRVQAVYEEQDVPPGEEVVPEEPAIDQPLRLFIEVDVSSPALGAAVDALSDALSAAIDSMSPRRPRRMIDAIVVDARERQRFLRSSRDGYRPPPLLLAAREQIAALDCEPAAGD